jgi:single-strand DNA-binding protein
MQYLRKGSKVFVSGKLATRKWTDKDGGDRYSTEVVLQGPGSILTMLDGPPEKRGETYTGGGVRQPAQGYEDDLGNVPF